MRKEIFAMMFLLAAITMGSQLTQAQNVPVCPPLTQVLPCLIDDFKTGEYQKVLRNNTLIAQQSGTGIIGGVRQTVFTVGPNNRFNEPTSLRIRPNGPMIVSAGLRSSWGIYLIYGVDAAGQSNPLNLNLSNFNRFRINFDSSDLTINYVMQVYDGSGNSSTFYGDLETKDRYTPFSADFPRAGFPPGSPNAIDWSDIDTVLFLFQAGTATLANDFAITSIKVQ